MKYPWDPKDPCTYGMPTIEEFTKMRSSYDKDKDIRSLDNKSTFLFYSYLLPSVGSVRIYANNMHKHTVSKIFSPSLEGYVLIELKNNYEKWTKQAHDEINNTTNKNRNVSEVTTNSEDNTSLSTCKLTLYTETKYYKSMDGWSQEGMAEYNRLCYLVAKDRKTELGKLFEEELLSMIKMERGLVAMVAHDDEQQFTVPYNDLLNDSVNDC